MWTHILVRHAVGMPVSLGLVSTELSSTRMQKLRLLTQHHVLLQSVCIAACAGGHEMHAMGQLIYIARALERSAPGSAFAPQAAAAAANVTAALQQLLLKVCGR